MKTVFKALHYFSLFFTIFSFSCSSGNQKDDLITFKVIKSDYTNRIQVTGTLDAKNTYTIICPDIWSDLTIIQLIPEGTYVNEGDTVCILGAGQLENDYREAVKNLEIKKSDYNKSIADFNLQKLLMISQLETIRSSTAISNLDSSKLAFTSPAHRKIIELELEKAKIEMDKIQKKMDFFKIINVANLRKNEMEIRQAENQVARQREQLDKLVITSDSQGLASYARYWMTGNKIKEGDIVWRPMPIIKIPDISEMQTKLIVNEAHFKRIEKDQHIDITIDAFPEILLTGKIRNKTPMGKPIKRGSPVKVFEVFSSVDSADSTLQPGLSISGDVILESIPDTIVVPLSAVFDKDSIKVVYINNGDSYKRQPVEVASSSENYAVISKGLRPDEEVILIEPPEQLVYEGSQ
jgi:multidrug efflux pump subunit AcrA (membrane-fusion protein)